MAIVVEREGGEAQPHGRRARWWSPPLCLNGRSKKERKKEVRVWGRQPGTSFEGGRRDVSRSI